MASFASGWTPIVELQSGFEVNNKLTEAFTQIDLGLAAVTDNTNKLIDIDPIYLFDKTQDVDIALAGTWYDIGNIDMLANPHAAYQYTMSFTHLLNSTQHSALYRFSIDGGVVWTQFEMEQSDKTDIFPFTYTLVKNRFLNQGLHLKLQASKEDAGDTMTVQFADVIIEKKLAIATP